MQYSRNIYYLRVNLMLSWNRTNGLFRDSQWFTSVNPRIFCEISLMLVSVLFVLEFDAINGKLLQMSSQIIQVTRMQDIMKHIHIFKFPVYSILQSEIYITYYEPINKTQCVKCFTLLDYWKSRNVFKDLTALNERISINDTRRLLGSADTAQNLLVLWKHVEMINILKYSEVFST
jgi:hypothetical protein